MFITFYYAPSRHNSPTEVFQISFSGRLETPVFSSRSLGAYVPLRWKPRESMPEKDIESTDGWFKQVIGAFRDVHWSACLSKNRRVSEKLCIGAGDGKAETGGQTELGWVAVGISGRSGLQSGNRNGKMYFIKF
ncbi:MAG: hypothetical protein ACI4CT_03470 [Lachnospiraceae bacterium]